MVKTASQTRDYRPQQVRRVTAQLKNHWQVIFLTTVTLVALSLRSYHLANALDVDEVWQYYSSAYPLGSIIPNIWPDHSPLYFFFSHFMLDLTGYTHDPVLLRLPTVLIGTLVVPCIYLLGFELTNNKIVALLAASLASYAPALINISQYYRMYALLMIFAVLSAYCLIRGLRHNHFSSWLGFICFNLFNLYNHYNAIFVIFDEWVFCLGWIFLQWLSLRNLSPNQRWLKYFRSNISASNLNIKQFKSRLLFLMLSFSFILLLYLPLLPHLLNFVLTPGYGVSRTAVKAPLNFSTLYEFTSRLAFGYDLGFWVSFILFIVGLFALFLKRPYEGLFCFCSFWLPVIIIAMLPSGGYFITNSRYYSFAAPVYLVVVAQGIFTFAEIARNLVLHTRFFPKNSLRSLFVPTILVIFVLGLLTYQTIYVLKIIYSMQSGLDEAGLFLQKNLKSEDTVFTLTAAEYGTGVTRTFLNNLAFPATSQTHILQHSNEEGFFEPVDQVVSPYVLQRLKRNTNNVWLALLLPSANLDRQVAKQKIEQTADTIFTTHCYIDVCIVGFNSNHVVSNQYDSFQKMVKAFEFFNPLLVQETLKLSNLSTDNANEVNIGKFNSTKLSQKPFYVSAAIDKVPITTFFYVKFKYKGSPSRIYVGLKDDKGSDIATVPDWNGYVPTSTNIETPYWSEDGFFFEAPPGTTHAIIALIGETEPAEINDVELFKFE